MRCVQHSMVNVPYAALYVFKVHYYKYLIFFKFKSKVLSCCIENHRITKNHKFINKIKYHAKSIQTGCYWLQHFWKELCHTTKNTTVGYDGWANLSSVNTTTHNQKGRTRVSKWLRRIIPSVTLGKWAGCFLLLRQLDAQKAVGIDPDQLAACWSRSVNISSEYLMSLTTQERETELRSRGVACSC